MLLSCITFRIYRVEKAEEPAVAESLKVASQSTATNADRFQNETDRVGEKRPLMAPSSPLPDKLKKMLADWSSKASNSRKNSTSDKKPADEGRTGESILGTTKKPKLR